MNSLSRTRKFFQAAFGCIQKLAMQLKVSNGSVHLKSVIITLVFWYNKLLTFSGSDINPNGIKNLSMSGHFMHAWDLKGWL
jgi:hypothetical protein